MLLFILLFWFSLILTFQFHRDETPTNDDNKLIHDEDESEEDPYDEDLYIDDDDRER